MPLYATLAHVKRGLPAKGGPSDADITYIIEDASAWVDSVYPNLAPFPEVGEGVFQEIAITEKAEPDATSIKIEASPVALDSGLEFMISTDVRDIPEQYVGAGSSYLDQVYGTYNSNRRDLFFDDSLVNSLTKMYTIYKLTSAVNQGATQISFSPKLVLPINEDQLNSKEIIIGTPPLVRRATILRARYWALSSGADVSRSDRIMALLSQSESLIGLTRMNKTKAMKKPHPKIYWSPGKVRIARRG